MKAQNDVIEKIKKLLSLAEHEATGLQDGTTPEEAATAAAKAQELLEKYNLDRSALGTPSKSTVVMSAIELKSRSLWVKNLFTIVATGNFCQFMFVSSRPVAWIVGEETNVAATKEMVRYLVAQFDLMCDSAYLFYQIHRTTGTPYANGTTFKTNFMNGAVNAVYHRLEAQRAAFIAQQAKEAASRNSNRALMVIDENQNAISDFLRNRGIATRKRTLQSRTANHHGYPEGVQAGKSVELNKLVK